MTPESSVSPDPVHLPSRTASAAQGTLEKNNFPCPARKKGKLSFSKAVIHGGKIWEKLGGQTGFRVPEPEFVSLPFLFVFRTRNLDVRLYAGGFLRFCGSYDFDFTPGAFSAFAGVMTSTSPSTGILTAVPGGELWNFRSGIGASSKKEKASRRDGGYMEFQNQD